MDLHLTHNLRKYSFVYPELEIKYLLSEIKNRNVVYICIS